jgi:hypothetical protein
VTDVTNVHSGIAVEWAQTLLERDDRAQRAAPPVERPLLELDAAEGGVELGTTARTAACGVHWVVDVDAAESGRGVRRGTGRRRFPVSQQLGQLLEADSRPCRVGSFVTEPGRPARWVVHEPHI